VAQCFFEKGCIQLLIHLKTHQIMRNLLYIAAVVLIIGWLIGVFAYSATGLIHILIVLAVVSLLVGVIRRGNL